MLWWSLAAVALLVAVVVGGAVLASRPGDGTPSAAPRTHDTVVPGTVPRPVVTAKRTGRSVEFRWWAADQPEAGDSFQWRLPRRGGTQLTTGHSVTVRSRGRVCLQVRLARPGLPPSTYAGACA